MNNKYTVNADLEILITDEARDYDRGIDSLIVTLNTQRGALFTSSFEFPGRYTCWDIGFCNPPLVLTCVQDTVHLAALNDRGQILFDYVFPYLSGREEFHIINQEQHSCTLAIQQSQRIFSEEERSRQSSVFSIIRIILSLFKSEKDPYLGLYGAFGFDLIYQFEKLAQSKERPPHQRDMVLYLPDELYIINHPKEEAFIRRYDFSYKGRSTQGLKRLGKQTNYNPAHTPNEDCDHKRGEYATLVTKAKERFICGDLFEVVPSQTFYTAYTKNPSDLFTQMRKKNPSPYGFLINLGEEEYLIGASPEMYVRVQGKRVETCPISGTISRGADAIEDAHNIQTLLASKKEESELTMCTDVDRNDKSRICEAGSVRVIGRRQIEMYSRLIHTVDHVEGLLREGFDAVDAFLTHMWVVTVTGAPKLWALDFIEEHEKSPRQWYGGAVGWFSFNGSLNSGLVLRTVNLRKGIASLRVGATLLFDSVPEHEEQETRLKASAFLDLLNDAEAKKEKPSESIVLTGANKRVLLIDHQDSFVHTLGNYLRQTGAEVITARFDKAQSFMDGHHYDLVVLSPGPGRPSDFNLAGTISKAIELKIPIFGVCLGLQGIVEYFGGDLDVLKYPMHGKSSRIKVLDFSDLFCGLEDGFTVGRYHSLYARQKTLPLDLRVTAKSDDDVIMAISHLHLPIYAVQFHPETILSLPNQAGLKIIINLMSKVG